jgi:O-antigen biosynthesis protein
LAFWQLCLAHSFSNRSFNHSLHHFDKMIATMWVTVKWLELFSNIDKKYYLVQNYETDFYEKGSPYRAMANATYCKNQIQYVTISKWCKEWLKERFEKECAKHNCQNANRYSFY